jgi:indolepyruvate ferredoxin oxidoreductase beta subunit
MIQKRSVVLTGVGGQGVITAANILGKAAIKANVNVYVSEVHGMAQRGGSVVCNVRMGNVSGPLTPNGNADAIVGMEPTEILRYVRYSNKKTKIITDITPIIPFTVATGEEVYPYLNDVYKEIEKYGQLYKIDAVKIAEEAGAIITKNIVMLGALAATGVLPFKSDFLLETILETVPTKYKDINKKAFQGGLNSIRN